MRIVLTALVLALTFVVPSFAGESDVVAVNVSVASDGTYRFDVTVQHADEGWNHYADGWEVLTTDGKRLGYRKLLHPHVDEQPFTRSLSGVEIPQEID